MKAKIYATDEGFGPLVRQSAIVEELLALEPSLDIALQTHRHLPDARWILEGVSFIDRYNNITWDKQPDGSPDMEAIRRRFADYEERSCRYVDEELERFDYDFVISDFVYEAFPVAQRRGVPSFGVGHFMWDWFFSRLSPSPLSSTLLKRLTRYAEMAEVLYFPPFTPKEILTQYGRTIKEVPLVVRKHESRPKEPIDPAAFQVLVMGSGSEVLKEQVQHGLRNMRELDDFHFFVSKEFQFDADNVTYINSKELFVDHIPHVDLVIARAGFNTISECIAFRTPMLLIGEALNPEMDLNMRVVKEERLGSFLSLDTFANDLNAVLPRFVKGDYPAILDSMRSHEIPTDGARVIAEDMLDRLT